MPGWVLKVFKWLSLSIVLLFVLVWLFLAAPFFSSVRGNFVANVLTEQIGQPFLVEGDVRVVLGATTRVHVSGARIPSTNIDDMNLARLDLLEWEVNLPALLNGRIDIDNLVIDGLQANLITKSDGTTSWIKTEIFAESEATDESEQNPDMELGQGASDASIFTFLRDRTVTFTNIGLLAQNEKSGFEFVFDLKNVLLKQLEDGELVSLVGDGLVNGEAFTLKGTYPRGMPFTNLARFGDIEVSYDGKGLTKDEGGGYTAKLTVDTGEIGDVFDVLGLERSLEGRGTLSADITSQKGLLAVRALEAGFDLSEGQSISISGDVGNFIGVEGVNIEIATRLHPENAPPKSAKTLKDLKLTRIDAHITSDNSELEFKKLVVQTNAFDQGLNKVGPISIGRVYRTPEKTLGLENVRIQAGPEDAPYIVATGDVDDVFTFDGVALDGTLAGDASLLLTTLSEEDADRFGGVIANFSVSDASGSLSLTKLDAETRDTDLWTLETDISVSDVTKLQGMNAKVWLSVVDTADFLTALNLKPIDAGKLELGLSLDRAEEGARLGVLFNAGGSDLETSFDFDLSQDINTVRGQIVSQRIRLADLRDGTQALMELGKMGDADQDNDSGKPPVQPLVLKDENADEPPVQPLVLEEEDKMFSLENILTTSDVEVSLEIKEFVGDAGTSSMNSQFTAKEGQVAAGPLELYYGDGFFTVTAKMDAIENPEVLHVSGSTKGWDFGKILKSIDLGIDASGTLNASFDIRGNISSGARFVNSLAGSAAVNMGNGSVATSLLELAGLGIFPWLFSKELAEGRTEIVCVHAPVRLNAGKVSFDSVVVETKSVQLVAKGQVDYVRDAISVRAEPRRVGAPLARSAWPFEVNGKLSKPEFKLVVGGSRSKRADGANKMPENRVPCQPDILQLK